MSVSLKIRIGMAIGVNTMGLVAYYREIFDKLEMMVTTDVYYYLHVKDTNRNKQISKAKALAAKRRCQWGKFEKLKMHTEEANRARCRRDGSVCQSGIGMDGGYLEDDATASNGSDNNAQRRRHRLGKCGICGEAGHDRQHCPQAKQPPTINEEEANLQADADEMDVYNFKPLVDEEDNGFFSAEEFESDSGMFGLI